MSRKSNTTISVNPIPVVADDTTWRFYADSISVMGHVYKAMYRVATDGDVYVFAVVDGIACRMHIGKGMPTYHAAFDAAMQARVAAAKAAKAKAAEPTPATDATPTAEPAKPAKAAKAKAAEPAKRAKRTAKPATDATPTDATPTAEPAKPAKPAKAAKAKAAKPAAKAAKAKAAKPATPAYTATDAGITGTGWRIVYDTDAMRTRVYVDGEPSVAVKMAIADAGFYYSPAMKSYNKKLTAKAKRAAAELAERLAAVLA